MLNTIEPKPPMGQGEEGGGGVSSVWREKEMATIID